jgi:integrase/recombinase XerD
VDLEEDLAKHDAIVDYFETKESKLSSDVLTFNRRVLGYFFVDTFPETEPSEITTEHVREFLDLLDERDLEYSSKRRYLEALSSFFSHALQRSEFDDIIGNPPGVLLEEYPRYSASATQP